MNALLRWLDHRTGIADLMHAALYEHVPGGAAGADVWGSTLVFAFTSQVITGVFLWMFYAPAARQPGRACITFNTRCRPAGCCAGCIILWRKRWSCCWRST